MKSIKKTVTSPHQYSKANKGDTFAVVATIGVNVSNGVKERNKEYIVHIYHLEIKSLKFD